MAGGRQSITVGVDIGTTATKAVAVDGVGRVLARARVPHRVLHPAAELIEHDARRAWRWAPRKALRGIGSECDDLRGVCVAAMVPSMAAVDLHGVPVGPGILYDDARIRVSSSVSGVSIPGGGSAERMLRWVAGNAPDALGYWPAQAVATRALGGPPSIDSAVAIAFDPLHHHGKWDSDLLADIGVGIHQLPEVAQMGARVGEIRVDSSPRVSVAAGTVDALCDQIVSGAVETGDVLVICGATLVVWAVVDEWIEAPGLWTVPHTVPGKVLVGGASNAGGLFVDWARSLVAKVARGPSHRDTSTLKPGGVPVWLPYPRGERVPYHEPGRRSSLHGMDVAMDARAVMRAAHEATGFVVRHILDRAHVEARRVVASGGGTRSTEWMQALADSTGLRVETVAVPEGAAYGAAYVARMAAGLESSIDGAMRWAAVGRTVDPNPAWREAVSERFRTFVDLSDRVRG